MTHTRIKRATAHVGPIPIKKPTNQTYIRANPSERNIEPTLEQNIEMRPRLGIVERLLPTVGLIESKGRGRYLKEKGIWETRV